MSSFREAVELNLKNIKQLRNPKYFTFYLKILEGPISLISIASDCLLNFKTFIENRRECELVLQLLHTLSH